jgi:hypothetical protein
MGQNNFHARFLLPDHHLHSAIPLKDIERRVHNELAHSLAGELVKHKCEEITIKRENHERDHLYRPWEQGTLYELDCFVLSRKEWNEYQSLLKFQKDMQKFVNVGEI